MKKLTSTIISIDNGKTFMDGCYLTGHLQDDAGTNSFYINEDFDFTKKQEVICYFNELECTLFYWLNSVGAKRGLVAYSFDADARNYARHCFDNNVDSL